MPTCLHYIYYAVMVPQFRDHEFSSIIPLGTWFYLNHVLNEMVGDSNIKREKQDVKRLNPSGIDKNNWI